MNRRKWFRFLIAAFACVGMGVFTACGDDDDPTPTPESPKFDKIDYEFVGTVNKSFAEFADVKMIVETPVGTDEHLLTGSAGGYKMSGISSASLPYKVKISFTCTPKAGFTPQEGVDYDAILSLDYAVYAYDTNGDKMAGDTQQLKITHAEGLELVDHFDEIWAAYAEEFPFHLSFTCEKDGDGVKLSKSFKE